MSTRKFRRPLRNPDRDKHAVWVKQLVWESALPPNEKLVAVVLAEHGDPYGNYIFPSLPAVSWWTSLSLATVKRTVRKLRTRGVLAVVEEHDPGEHRPTEYRIDADKLPANVERSKFLAEYRKLKRAEQTRRAERRGEHMPQGVTVIPQAGCQPDTPSRVSKRPPQGVSLTPEERPEAASDSTRLARTGSGDVLEVPKPQHRDGELRDRALAWTEESPWAYRRFIRAVELACSDESVPMRDFDGLITQLARKHGVPPRFAHILALGDPEADA